VRESPIGETPLKDAKTQNQGAHERIDDAFLARCEADVHSGIVSGRANSGQVCVREFCGDTICAAM